MALRLYTSLLTSRLLETRLGRTLSRPSSHCTALVSLLSTSSKGLSWLTELQSIRRLALHRQLLQPIHLWRRHRHWHRQYSPEPSPTRHAPLLFLRRPHTHPQQHLFQHHLPRLAHRIYRFRREFRARTRYITQWYTAGATESAGSDGACKRHHVEILGSAGLADQYAEWDMEAIEERGGGLHQRRRFGGCGWVQRWE